VTWDLWYERSFEEFLQKLRICIRQIWGENSSRPIRKWIRFEGNPKMASEFLAHTAIAVQCRLGLYSFACVDVAVVCVSVRWSKSGWTVQDIVGSIDSCGPSEPWNRRDALRRQLANTTKRSKTTAMRAVATFTVATLLLLLLLLQ